MNKKMSILSIHYGHDSSACILKDGEIVLFFKEERLTRNKRDNVPFESIKACLDNFSERLDYIIITSTEKNPIYNFILRFLKVYLKKIEIPIIDFTGYHHLTHVGTSFFNSGFDESLVIVVDGRGSSYKNQLSECESVYKISYNNSIPIPIIKNYFIPTYMPFDDVEEETYDEIITSSHISNIFNKVGGVSNLYTTAVLLIGEDALEAGKVMGLSSYGEKIKNFPNLFADKYGRADDSLYSIHKYEDLKAVMPIYNQHIGKITSKITKENYKFYANYAYEVQTQTQEIVGNIIEKSVEETGIRKVCISGGYGMNIVANHYYLKRFPNIDFFFEPLSDDSGGAIGAAKMFWYSETNDKTIRKLKTTSIHGIHHDVSFYKNKTFSLKKIAKLLNQNKSIAIYTGLSESGQRALGNRSIFFNALNSNAKNLVNKIKKREWYRPFACVVLEEDAKIYFDMGTIKLSPFMTISFPVKQKYQDLLSGIIHVDNTCRIQTVSKENEYLYELLCEFKKLSGHGILLNTSFNLAGEPLVETPEDAFSTLNNSCLDYLWFEETKQLFENKKSCNLKYL